MWTANDVVHLPSTGAIGRPLKSEQGEVSDGAQVVTSIIAQLGSHFAASDFLEIAFI